MNSVLYGVASSCFCIRQCRSIAFMSTGYAFLLVTGCGTSPSIDAPSELTVPVAAIGETVQAKVLVRHHGNGQLSFFRFEIDLSDEYKLDWCSIDSRTGEASGAPKIAGYHNGRILFPKMLDLLPGQDLLLMLTYTPTSDRAPGGRIAMASNDPARPRLVIIIRPATGNGARVAGSYSNRMEDDFNGAS